MSKNPTWATILSFCIPGVGQFYNGDILRGIGWLVLAMIFDVPLLIFTLGAAGPFSLLVHAVSAYTAYKRANEINTVMGGYYQG